LFFVPTSLKLLLFISLAMPQVITEASFAIAIVILFFAILYSKLSFDKSTLSLVLVGGMTLIGLYGSILGIYFLNDLSGVYANFKIYYLYPLFGLFLIPIMKKNLSFDDILYVCFAALTFIALTFFLQFLQLYFFDTIFLVNFDWVLPKVSLYEGRYVITALSVPNLIILFPIFLFACFDKRARDDRLLVYVLALLIVSLLILISGRRMIWLLSFIVCFSLFMHIFLRNVILRLFIGTLIAFFLYIFLWQDLSSLFMLKNEISQDSVRVEQSSMLLRSFTEYPLGLGFGSLFYDSRGYDSWMFEMAWLKLLVDTGIVFLIWSFLLVVVLTQKYLRINREHSHFLLNGFYWSLICWFLLGFSNPSFSNFDGLLVLFMLLSVLTKSSSYDSPKKR